jgi:hypothetical protein
MLVLQLFTFVWSAQGDRAVLLLLLLLLLIIIININNNKNKSFEM